jgi:hypothetical protein
LQSLVGQTIGQANGTNGDVKGITCSKETSLAYDMGSIDKWDDDDESILMRRMTRKSVSLTTQVP